MHDELNEIPGATPDFRTELAEKLADLVPEAVADGKIDTKKLEELLDGDAADTRERFGLFWPGKKRALRAAQESTTATLVPDRGNSKDWDTTQNVFIEGDNLEVLKILQKHYHGKIKMIYVDPPYNTGQDFVYPDNYQEGLKSYLEFTKQVDEGGKKLSTNSDQAGRYHSNWLNMMYPRLKLARNLLRRDGFIAVSIDDNEAPRLRKLMDEVFGSGNFVAQVIVQANKGGRDYLPLAQTHEYVIIYARSYDDVGITGLPRDDSDMPFVDEKGRYEARELRNRNPKFNRTNRPNLFYPFYADPETQDDNGFCSVSLTPDDRHAVEVLPLNSEGGESCWRWGKPRSLENTVPGDPSASQVAAKQVRSGRWNIYEKNRPTSQKAKTIWDETEVRTEAGTREVRALLGSSVFDHPKPIDLIGRLVAIGTEAQGRDTILDFFAGSGSTGHATMRANAADGGNRKWLQVQLPEPVEPGTEGARQGYRTIAEIARVRLLRAAEQLTPSTNVNVDTGFRVLKLSDTNFAKWRLTSDVAETELEQHLLSLRESADAQASQEALLTELLLKRGYSLTEQVDVFDVAGLEIHGVNDAEGDYGLLAYLNEHQKPSLEQLRALVAAAEAQVVILEDAFQGDDQLKTNLAQLCKSKGIELWTA